MNEKKVTIRIFGYHMAIFLAGFLIVGMGALLLWEIVLDIEKDGFNAISKILVILLFYYGVVMFFGNIIKLASKKILLYENYLMIDDIKIEYKDIIGINVVDNNYNISGGYLHMGKGYAKTTTKENYLKIMLSDGISTEYFVGQFSINNIRKIVKYIESKTNCNVYDTYENLDVQDRANRRGIIVVIIAIILLLLVFVGIPYINIYWLNT